MDAQPDELHESGRLRAELEELRASRLRLQLAADEDRRLIERALHQGVQQDLVALAVKVQRAESFAVADPGATRSLLEEIGRDLQQALDAAAELAQRIHPPLLDAGGLTSAVRTAARSAGVRATVDVPASATYPPEVAASVYWCCVAAFDCLDAGALATVTVREEGDTVVLDVAARALDTALERSRDRVAAVGGRLEVVSEPGDGVRVRAELPLAR